MNSHVYLDQYESLKMRVSSLADSTHKTNLNAEIDDRINQIKTSQFDSQAEFISFSIIERKINSFESINDYVKEYNKLLSLLKSHVALDSDQSWKNELENIKETLLKNSLQEDFSIDETIDATLKYHKLNLPIFINDNLLDPSSMPSDLTNLKEPVFTNINNASDKPFVNTNSLSPHLKNSIYSVQDNQPQEKLQNNNSSQNTNLKK